MLDFPVKLAGQQFVVRFSWSGFAALCRELRANVSNVTEVLATADATDMDALLWAGLVHHHPGLTRETVRGLMDETGVVGSMAAIETASGAFLAALEPEGGGSTARPLWARLASALGRLIVFWKKPSRSA